jgi:hypothetical protein
MLLQPCSDLPSRERRSIPIYKVEDLLGPIPSRHHMWHWVTTHLTWSSIRSQVDFSRRQYTEHHSRIALFHNPNPPSIFILYRDTHIQPTQRWSSNMSLTSLPTELHLAIMVHLGYDALVNMKLISHHFFNVVTKTHIQEALFSFKATNRDKLMQNYLCPCYTCFKIKCPGLYR